MARFVLQGRAAPVLLAAGLLLAGCSDDRSGGSALSPAGDRSSLDPVFLGAPATASGTSSAAEFTSKTIGPSGGDVRLGNLKVDFDRGALSAATVITLRRVDGEHLMLLVEPASLQLASPVRITFEHLGSTDSGRYADVAVFRMSGSQWVALATVPSRDKHEAVADSLGSFALASTSADGGDLQFVRYLSGPGYVTELIDADEGGTITLDRYELKVPKNALDVDTYITVRNPGDGYVTCELEPHGIVFNVPVVLKVDLKGLAYQPFEDWSLYWYNDLGQWEDMGGTFKDEKVTTYLPHFSLYRIAIPGGRAGW